MERESVERQSVEQPDMARPAASRSDADRPDAERQAAERQSAPVQPPEENKGRLIVIEGTDGVGRTEQVSRLRDWLEIQGYGVVETGWTRSQLMAELIDLAKEGNTLTKHTFSLLYATDFADRLQSVIMPALRAGFVVLSDRYIYTAFARHTVRGGNPRWIRNVYGFAPQPDAVVYLHADIQHLIPRVLHGKGMDYWESGMDMGLSDDLFDSFTAYQTKMIAQYDAMQKEFGFRRVDTSGRSIREIHEAVKDALSPLVRHAKQLEVSVADLSGSQTKVK